MFCDVRLLDKRVKYQPSADSRYYADFADISGKYDIFPRFYFPDMSVSQATKPFVLELRWLARSPAGGAARGKNIYFAILFGLISLQNRATLTTWTTERGALSSAASIGILCMYVVKKAGVQSRRYFFYS